MFGIKKKDQKDSSDVRLLPAKEKARYDWKAAIAKAMLVFLLVYGSIGGFLSAYEIEYQRESCILAIFWLSFLLSAVYETKRKWAVNLVNIFAFLIYMYVAYQTFWTINSGYYAIINRILNEAGSYLGVAGRTEYGLVVENENTAVTGFAVFLGMVGTILIHIRLHHKASLWTVILLTLPLYAIPFYFEKVPGTGYMILLLTGYAAVAALQGSGARERMAEQVRDMLPAIMLFVIILLQLLTLALPRADYASLVRANAAKKASENRIANIVQFGLPALFGRGANGAGVSGGMLSKGFSVMPDYETDLIVRYTPYDYEPVYLKAFTGKDYRGDHWTRADDDDAWMEQTTAAREERFVQDDRTVKEAAAPLDEDRTGSSQAADGGITGNAADGGAVLGQGCGVMEIDNVGASEAYEYRPYYTSLTIRGGLSAKYVYYPPVIEMRNVTEEVDGDYLTVPVSCSRAVEQVCAEAGFSGTPREIAAQVRTYFDENYTYTLRPGFYYGSPDYITHFLTESKRGYCAHFASSAVMLFRYMGIPARYAEGYAFTYEEVILDGALVEDADYARYYSGYAPLGETALVELEIADALAHAWVEIYIEGEGWIVVDPTPASGGEEERLSFWEDFLNRSGDAEDAGFGESPVGTYIATALGGLTYGVLVVAAALFFFFTGRYLLFRIKEARLPAKERAKLEYRRMISHFSRRYPEFAVLRTISEQTEWVNAHCRRGFEQEQNAALYVLFFAEESEAEKNADWAALAKQIRVIRMFPNKARG